MRKLTILLIAMLLVAFATQICFSGWTSKKIRGSGDVVTEDREVRGITGVELATIGKLFIEVGDEEKLVVEAEDNLLEYIDTDVHGGMLVIQTRDGVNLHPREQVRYYLTVKRIDEIEISSSGDIETSDLIADRFSITIGSSGDLDIRDLSVSSLDVRVRSSGDVSMDKVSAKKVEIDIQSSGDVVLRELESELLVVDISSSGDVEVGTGYVKEQEININSSGDYEGKGLESEETSVSINSSGSATVQVNEYLDARTNSSGNIYYLGDPEVRKRSSSSGRVKQIK